MAVVLITGAWHGWPLSPQGKIEKIIYLQWNLYQVLSPELVRKHIENASSKTADSSQAFSQLSIK